MADRNSIMTHLVAGYPTGREALNVARAMIEGGASFLEVQFPFSDPLADGPLIQGACTASLAGGFTTERGFDFVSRLTGETDVPVFIMTYGNIAVAAGIGNFTRKAREAGAAGLIIPDLPYDYDEGLYEAGEKSGIPIVPVVIPEIDPERLDAILDLNPPWIYTAIRKGITGTRSSIDDTIVTFLEKLSETGTNVLAGFGIRERAQVEILAPHVCGTVVGSALVDIIGRSYGERGDCSGAVREFVASLV